MIGVLPNYWNKFEFTVSIFLPQDSKIITGSRYRELVIEAFEIWEKILHDYAKKHQECKHLEKIKFKISDTYQNNDDIQVNWNFSNPSNGLTSFDPSLGLITNSYIIIAKNHGPLIENMELPEEQYGNELIPRDIDQIRSAALHEIGHALGLGHCNFSKDLMYTFSDDQPDPQRRISNLDVEIICQKFRIVENPQDLPLQTTHMISLDSWVPLH